VPSPSFVINQCVHCHSYASFLTTCKVTEIYDRNMKPCNTAKYGRLRAHKDSVFVGLGIYFRASSYLIVSARVTGTVVPVTFIFTGYCTYNDILLVLSFITLFRVGFSQRRNKNSLWNYTKQNQFISQNIMVIMEEVLCASQNEYRTSFCFLFIGFGNQETTERIHWNSMSYGGANRKMYNGTLS
jgi:hypothetical protein